MKEFTGSIQFIVFFLVLTLAIAMVLGEKVAHLFLWLVLLGMMVTNAEKVTQLFNRFSGNKSVTQDMGNGVFIA